MHTASYNLHDDRLKLFLDQGDRIPREEYLALKKLGLAWWRGSKCLSGIWTPEREDAILGYVEEIEFLVDDVDARYTWEQRDTYAPATSTVRADGRSFRYAFAPHSFTQIRVRVQ